MHVCASIPAHRVVVRREREEIWRVCPYIYIYKPYIYIIYVATSYNCPTECTITTVLQMALGFKIQASSFRHEKHTR